MKVISAWDGASFLAKSDGRVAYNGNTVKSVLLPILMMNSRMTLIIMNSVVYALLY